MSEPSANGPLRPWIMNAFVMSAPGHLAPGLWRHPDQDELTLDHWVRLAKLLEEAKFHGVFFADVLGIYDVYKGPSNNTPALQSAAQIPIGDPSLLISAMAHATKSLSFGVTASTTYENPYALARKFATLDHISQGRVGWNIVTSYLDSAAKSYGLDEQIPHDERYARADEFMQVVYKLLEGSWQEGGVVKDKKTGLYANPNAVKRIDHKGKYYQCAGPSLLDPSPQRTPFLLQAGASASGQKFAATHSEAMFLPGLIPEKTRKIVDDTRALLVQQGRKPDSVRFLTGIFIVVDETDEKAQAKFEDLLQYADLEGTAALFGGWTGTDLANFTDDEDFAFTGLGAIQSMIKAWTATVPGTEGLKWTKRRVLEQLAISGAHAKAIGSPKTVADILQRWVTEAGIDGFNLSYATTPGTFEDMIKYLWPELRARGVLQDDYPVPGGSMRETFLADGHGPRVRADHPAAAYTWK
ncbi:hypothetical protein diail_5649 [Diaporthe ilicicola]|nr:hypothetical protein diail_5649 [Diaporthe ilicicola]